MTQHGSPSSFQLEAVLNRVKPQLTRLFSSHEIKVSEAAVIVEQTMLALLHKWDEIEAPEDWLCQTVERRCRRLVMARGRTLVTTKR